MKIKDIIQEYQGVDISIIGNIFHLVTVIGIITGLLNTRKWFLRTETLQMYFLKPFADYSNGYVNICNSLIIVCFY